MLTQMHSTVAMYQNAASTTMLREREKLHRPLSLCLHAGISRWAICGWPLLLHRASRSKLVREKTLR